MTHWISKSELSREGKCSPSLFTDKCKKGSKWDEAGAISAAGNVDIDHPIIIKWLKSRDIVISPNDLSTKEFDKMTVKRIISHYGNVTKLESYVKVRKLLAETEHKQVMMAEKRNQLVDRETIAKACFGFLESATQRLLELPKGVVERIGAILETGTPSVKEESETFLIEEISKILKGVKREISDKLELALEKQQELEFEEDVLDLEDEDEDDN